MEPGEWTAFGLGTFGGLILEIVQLGRSYRRGRDHDAARYFDPGYWLVILVIAAGSGVVAWAYYTPEQPRILYIQIGVAAPTILLQFKSLFGDPND